MTTAPAKRFPAASRLRYMDAPIRDVLGPARELERQGHKVLKLNIGDPDAYDFVPPEPLQQALRDAAGQGRYADSEGQADIRQAIARYEKELRGVELRPEDVVFTAGVSEALQFLFGAMLEPGDEILVPGPAYPQYLGVTSFYGAVPVEYPSTPQNGWIPRIEDIASRVTPRTKAIAVISPNNPTGAVYPRATIQAIARLAQERGLVLIADDIYSELVFEGDGVAPSPAQEPGPCVILNGFSKNWLVPGWRAGYIAFKHENGELAEIREGVLKQARSRLSASYPIQLALANALQARAPHIPELRRKLRERAEIVVKRVAETPNLALSPPGGAFYALVGIRGLYPEQVREGDTSPARHPKPGNKYATDKEWVLGLLKEEKVLVVHGSGFGQSAAGHFRTVILPPPETLHEAFDRIIRFADRAAKP
ncbi:MAG TPA: aminotransferase class I/II-fold pyridoxal phosphate-dependent enzyme [Candidatus Thermoplasmatota archaeon]|nr:aminotransferase class I/II-fold pyridoxal phosphate-dependent enzyme [Candidatus Thermoplasmatota archaeon]